MFKRTQTAIFSILVLTVLLVLCLQQWSQSAKGLGGLLLSPFTAVGNAVLDGGSAVYNRFRLQEGLISENEALQKQSAENQLKLVLLKEIESENDRLREALELQKRTPWKLKLARVVGRDPSNWWHTITIGAGSEDGIKPNQPVLATIGEAALVGRVQEVGKWKSTVVLVGDPNCLVSATVGQTRTSGVLQPLVAASQGNTMVKLSDLSSNQELIPGERIYTSGMGGTFPGGIYVGTIEGSIAVEYGLYKEARIKLAVDANLLEEVWVLIQ